MSENEYRAAGNTRHLGSLLSCLSDSLKALSSVKLVVLNSRAINDRAKLWTCNSMRTRNHGDFEKLGAELILLAYKIFTLPNSYVISMWRLPCVYRLYIYYICTCIWIKYIIWAIYIGNKNISNMGNI